MTNQTNLDYLFQLTAPPERGANGAAPSGISRREFGDHLFQATAPSSSSRSTRQPRSNALDTSERQQDRSTSKSDERTAADSAPYEESADVSAANDPVEEASDDQPAATNETGNGTVNESRTISEEDRCDDRDEEESNEVVSAAIADGEAARQSQTALGAQAEGAADVADAESPAAAADTAGAHENAGAQPGGRGPEQLAAIVSTTAPNGENVGLPIDVSSQTQFVDAKIDEQTANPIDRPSSQTGKATNKESDKSHARDPQAGSATVVGVASEATEFTAESKTRNANEATVRDNPVGNELSRAEDQVREKSEAGPERRDEAASTANRGRAPEIVAAQAAQQASSTANADGSGELNRPAPKPVGANGDVVPMALGRSQRIAKGPHRAAPGQSGDLPRVDAARFVGRVAKAVQVAQERGGALQLRLSPPELGSLRLELTVHNGVMTASLETETPSARQVLLGHLPALRDRLAEQNIRVERFDVDVRQEQQSGGNDSRASQHHERHQQPHQSNSQPRAERMDAPESVSDDRPVILSHVGNSGINVLA